MNNWIKSHAVGIAWMLAGSILTVSIGNPVPPWISVSEPETRPAGLSEESKATESETEAFEDTEPEALPNVLNLVHFFPEGADSSDVLNSKMGAIYQELQILDQNWLDSIYNLSGMTPEQMAGQLGRPLDSIMGKYNRKDENHNPEDPDSWKVGSWKRIHVNVLDGDGNPASGDSNVKEILSMANVYTYYQNYQDSALFSEYAKELWYASHSYEVSMSEVYYCDGCMDLTEEEEMAEDIADLQAEEISPFPQDLAGKEADGEQTAVSRASGPGVFLDAAASDASPAEAPEASHSAESGSEASVPAASAPEKNVSPAEAAESSGSAPQAAVLQAEAPPDTAQESLPISAASPSEIREPGDYIEMLLEAERSSDIPDPSEALPEITPALLSDMPAEEAPVSCPGHIDLTITVHITGLSEANNLYALDSRGNQPFGSSWNGWSDEMKAYAQDLVNQDWYEQYGLTISNIALQMSMSPDEIDRYMSMLPTDLSQERMAVIRFALESVGRVPYYWGGKPSTKGYLGNMFGSLIEPDYKGRIKKGLDCSGWISWVYWSATGERLPAEGTSGLISCGTGISRSQLQPGDIIVRTGPNAHVVMFLAWGNDGKILCIHETSGPANNVTISELDANWKYYRKLIE